MYVLGFSRYFTSILYKLLTDSCFIVRIVLQKKVLHRGARVQPGSDDGGCTIVVIFKT